MGGSRTLGFLPLSSNHSWLSVTLAESSQCSGSLIGQGGRNKGSRHNPFFTGISVDSDCYHLGILMGFIFSATENVRRIVNSWESGIQQPESARTSQSQSEPARISQSQSEPARISQNQLESVRISQNQLGKKDFF